MRGQMLAIYLFGINLAGIGLGPTIVALMNEQLFGGEGAVKYAIALIVVLTAPISAFCIFRACKHYRDELSAARLI